MESNDDVFDQIESARVVPVVSEADPEKAMRLADALSSGGLPVVEIALRAEGAIQALRAVAARDGILPIAGTVLSAEQVDAAADAGARLIVSPGFSPAVVQRAQELAIPICPGVMTPTDIQAALALGVRVLKFFPAETAGGPPTLRALAAPFPMVRFMPTGGVTEKNLLEYLGMDCVVACGGSWMVKRDLYENGDYAPVLEATREAVRLASTVTGQSPTRT